MKTIDISGMGPDYENECQKMLWAGVEYLKSSPGEISFKELSNVFGIINTEDNSRAKECENIIAKAAEGCTGAMVHAVMSHLAYISRHGVEEWLSETENTQLIGDKNRIFEWDGTEKSCSKG